MSVFLVDNEAMNKFFRENTGWSFHRSRVYDEVSKMKLSLLDRETEYVRRMNQLPDDIRRTDDPLYKKSETPFTPFIHQATPSTPLHASFTSFGTSPKIDTTFGVRRRMQPPSVLFEDETDLDNYYEGSSFVSNIASNQESTFASAVSSVSTTQENHVRYFFRPKNRTANIGAADTA